MLQSDIFAQIYENFKAKLDNLTNGKNLSSIFKNIKKTDASYELYVNDIWQTMSDKNGDKIVVDEKLYIPPSYYQMIFTVLVKGADLDSVLKLYGSIARYLKDDSAIEIGECNWHLNEDKFVYAEPIIRQADPSRINNGSDGMYSFALQYEIYVGVNSLNGAEFVRTRERIISGTVK